jgi:hypothetical protein
LAAPEVELTSVGGTEEDRDEHRRYDHAFDHGGGAQLARTKDPLARAV